MRNLLVEEWVHIPEGGKLFHLLLSRDNSYIDSEDKSG